MGIRKNSTFWFYFLIWEKIQHAIILVEMIQAKWE